MRADSNRPLRSSSFLKKEGHILSLRWLDLSLEENNGKMKNKSPLRCGSYNICPFFETSLYLLPRLPVSSHSFS